jgi:uncharacterized ubiquitin-like protein YukD
MVRKTACNKYVKIRIDTIVGYWDKEFPVSIKVKDVLHAVIRHFELTRSGCYALKLKRKSETILIPSRSLSRYRITNGDVLILEVIGII